VRCGAIWLVLFCIASGHASAAPSAWPKVTRLADGSSVSVWQTGRVVERDPRGHLMADSNCGSYLRYQRWVAFMSSLRAAVLANDRAGVAAHVSYPLRWNHGSRWHSTMFGDSAALTRDYSTIFRSSVVGAIRAADPHLLFCHEGTMVMLGSGVIWGDDGSGRIGVISINGSPT
jgi:hypothetical protein